MTIQESLAAVMRSVLAVRKTERNTHGGYNFRGIDAVVNAVGPALREHKVMVLPNVREYHYGEILTGKDRRPMGHARVVVEYVFHAEDGTSLTCSAAGEAFDSGDKATPKAMSVAMRTALLQALCLPTDEPDPDAHTYERAEPDPLEEAKRRAWHASANRATSDDARRQLWSEALAGNPNPTAADFDRLAKEWSA